MCIRNRFVGGVFIGFVAAGALFCYSGTQGRAQTDIIRDTVKGHEFVLLDSSNRVVARLKPSSDGKGILEFFGADGHVIWSAPGPRAIPAGNSELLEAGN